MKLRINKDKYNNVLCRGISKFFWEWGYINLIFIRQSQLKKKHFSMLNNTFLNSKTIQKERLEFINFPL